METNTLLTVSFWYNMINWSSVGILKSRMVYNVGDLCGKDVRICNVLK